VGKYRDAVDDVEIACGVRERWLIIRKKRHHEWDVFAQIIDRRRIDVTAMHLKSIPLPEKMSGSTATPDTEIQYALRLSSGDLQARPNHIKTHPPYGQEQPGISFATDR
jgi:hypothetical protein